MFCQAQGGRGNRAEGAIVAGYALSRLGLVYVLGSLPARLGSPREKNSVYGLVNFEEIDVGDYYLTVSDPDNDYSSQTSSDFTVVKDQTARVTVTLSRVVNATLEVNVTDKGTQQNIQNALVELMDGSKMAIGRIGDKVAFYGIDESFTEG